MVSFRRSTGAVGSGDSSLGKKSALSLGNNSVIVCTDGSVYFFNLSIIVAAELRQSL